MPTTPGTLFSAKNRLFHSAIRSSITRSHLLATPPPFLPFLEVDVDLEVAWLTKRLNKFRTEAVFAAAEAAEDATFDGEDVGEVTQSSFIPAVTALFLAFLTPLTLFVKLIRGFLGSVKDRFNEEIPFCINDALGGSVLFLLFVPDDNTDDSSVVSNTSLRPSSSSDEEIESFSGTAK